MNPPIRIFRIVLAAAVAVALSGTAVGLAPEQGHTVSVHGTVATTDLPFSIVLEDGTRVELDLEKGMLFDHDPGSPGPGDDVVVVGRGSVSGGVLSVRSAGLAVQKPSGRQIPLPADPCSVAGASLDSAFSATRSRTAVPSGRPAGPAGASAQSENDMTELTGTVLSVGAQSFQLQPENADPVEISVNEDTEYHHLDSIADLAVGDEVRVKGTYSGSRFEAARVELISEGGGEGSSGGAGSGVHTESTGAVTAVLPPDAFRLDDGRTYQVDGATIYKDGLNGYGDIGQGQFLKVKASYSGGVYTAREIELEGDSSGGQEYLDFKGDVTTVGANTLSLDDGSVVFVVPSTRFEGDADALQEIEPGWRVEVHALLNNMDQLIALELRSDDPSPATTSNEDFEPRQALLVLVDTADPSAVAERYDASVAGTVGDLGVLFQWDGDELTDELLARINADAQVLAVEPNYHFRDPEGSRKRFPVVDRSPAVEKYLQQPAVSQIQLPPALSRTDGAGAVVAIMDTGVEPCHPLIQDRLLPGGMDTVDGDLEPWETRDGLDEDGDGYIDEAAGHGTFVASVIALAAPGARILPYRVLDDDGGGTAYELGLALADAIDRGVDVINISLTYHRRSTVVDLLLERAAARGIVVVAAAGNDPGNALPFPAVDSHVLAVTALAPDGASLASFAATSPQAPLAAPGEEVYGALDRGRYGLSSGTSMAAPFVAAAAALIRSLDPSIPPSLVDQALVQGGVPLSDGSWQGSTLEVAAALSLVAP